MLNKHTVGQKLVAAFGAITALTLILAVGSIATLRNLGNTLEATVHRTATTADSVGEIASGVANMKANAKMVQFAYMLGRMLDPKVAASCTGCHAIPDRESARREFDAIASGVRGNAAALRASGTGSETREALEAIDRGAVEWSAAFDEFLTQAASGNFEKGHAVITDRMEPIRERMDKAGKRLDKAQEVELSLASADARASVSHSRWLAIVFAAICFLAGAAVMLLVRTTSTTIRDLAVRLAHSSELFAAQSSELASASDELAEGASRQAAALEEIRETGVRVNESARSNVEEARRMAGYVREIRSSVGEASVTLGKSVEAMHGIDDSSSQIAKIIKVIDEIAFQTNLLALNAAVEAARAGQSGQGFAVVADEVRGLAQRCATAAKETETLIRESIGRSHDGCQRLETLAGQMDAIVERSARMETAVGSLESASTKQSEAVGAMGQSLTEIGSITENTAASAEEASATGKVLLERSSHLDVDVQQLAGLFGR